ncbi:DUF1351 domain-containing protein [Oceanobacillus kapialis]|uniref:DUF1351 domain-containing protein n=1 Tax=Oceanobacillus kapialis TaxID=481353 RepID=A0ABW5PZC5_9BACI
MNELQVKTIELIPAAVEFNFDELSVVLDKQLKKYEGLEFTDKDATACKKTITELNKGKKALDTYRKETKKELTKSVTDFEKQCKELGEKFDSVINPLKEQHDQFEEERKNIKRLEIEGYIDHLVHVESLNEKYAAKLVVEDSYLTKSKTMKSIKAELLKAAEHFGIQQDKEEADQEVIKSHVELVNTKRTSNLPISSYITLLDYQSVEEIKERIEYDAQKKVSEVQYEQVPFSSAPASVSTDQETYAECYEVNGEEHELEMLEEYMSSNGLTWKVIEK